MTIFYFKLKIRFPCEYVLKTKLCLFEISATEPMNKAVMKGQIFVYYNRIIGILVPIPSRSESPQNQNLRGDIFVLCCHGPCNSGVHAGPSKFSFPKMPCSYCGVSLILYLTPRRSHNVELMMA